MDNWLQLIIEANLQQAEALSDHLSEFGALSVCLQDAADQPVYEPALHTTPLWKQTRVVGLFEPDTDMPTVLARLAAANGELPPHRVEVLQDQDWVRVSLQDFHPMRFGRRLWICPSWEHPPEPEAVNIFLDPGLAFGTGTHPTTALCLEWLDAQDSLTGRTCLDYGCGSGILALAAGKLGASDIWAVDNDPQALQATHENAGKNQVILHTALPEQLPSMRVDILLANILANPLRDLAEHFAQLVHPGGAVVLSGILAEQKEEVRSTYLPYFEMDPTVEKSGWVRVSGWRRA